MRAADEQTLTRRFAFCNQHLSPRRDRCHKPS